ncbi:MAG TPA: aliphatic sulfonate ABC transporter substrate-binding protein [Beijerinckiaceae bacterium]|nr:aliphatic sulfonate ABC transporter substrate-binding protein [Beijerinckiaceae bacterium]
MKLSRRGFLATAASVALARPALAQKLSLITLDWATYNPLSLIIRDNKWLEEDFAKESVAIRWVQSAGSNKALEFLNASSIDFGSTAGAAALLGRIGGNPIRSVAVYSRPEWTALVTKGDKVKTVADLKGKSVAVTRGTDPHIFLIRALLDHGVAASDVKFVLLQHADGKTALVRGDVDAWAGLDPIMAQAEVEDGARLFYRKPENNTWGILNAREDFAAKNPEIVKRVIAVYEKARKHALANPKLVVEALVKAARLPDTVIAKQIERTDFGTSVIGPVQAEAIEQAGLALQKAEVIKGDVNVKATVAALIDASFTSGLKS